MKWEVLDDVKSVGRWMLREWAFMSVMLCWGFIITVIVWCKWGLGV